MYRRLQRWVFRSCDRTRWGRNREGKSARSSRLTSTKKCKGYAEVFEINKLL